MKKYLYAIAAVVIAYAMYNESGKIRGTQTQRFQGEAYYTNPATGQQEKYPPLRFRDGGKTTTIKYNPEQFGADPGTYTRHASASTSTQVGNVMIQDEIPQEVLIIAFFGGLVFFWGVTKPKPKPKG